MGRKADLPGSTLPTRIKPTLRSLDWWQEVRGGMRQSVKYLGEKLPHKLYEFPRKVGDLEALTRKLSVSSLNSNEQLSEHSGVSWTGSGRLYDPLPEEGTIRRREDGTVRGREESRLRDRLSIILPRYERLGNTVRSVRRDLSKLRSKSCDRILRRRKAEHPVLPPAPTAAVSSISAATEFDEEYFQINSTLRRSRRLEPRRKKYTGPYVGVARAKVDCIPSPYDTEGLPFKAGDLIQIIRRGPSGIWVGEVNGRTGNFKFINVEELESLPRAGHAGLSESTLTGLLCRLELAHLTSRLVLNGWDSLAKLARLARKDLIYLGIEDREEQDKLLTAVSVLQDLNLTEDTASSASRLDSGYYDLRDSESEGSEKMERILRSPSFDSLGLYSSPESSNCDNKSLRKDSILLRKRSPEATKFATKILELEARERTGSEPYRRFESITESRLSLAEPNPQLNKSF